jgi:hypothetical protein
VPIEYSDIEGVDPDYYKSLSQILDYDLEDIGLELTFSADVQTFGRNEVRCAVLWCDVLCCDVLCCGVVWCGVM